MRPKRLPLRFVIYLLLLTMLATGLSLSRYKTTVAGSATVSVARPVVEYVPNPAGATLNGAPVVWSDSVVSGLKPGDVLRYPFVVRNHNGGGLVNEVTMRYQVLASVTPVSGLNQQYTLTLLRDGIPHNGADELGFGAQSDHNYTLQITWNGTYSSQGYQNKNQTVTISLNAVQID